MTSDAPSTIWRHGEHTVHFEPPDICVVRFGETVTLQDGQAIYAQEVRLTEEHGEIFLLSDLTRVRVITPEARKQSAEMSGTPLIVGIVNFGLSFPVRVLATMVIKLRRLANLPTFENLFMVADETEARAVIAEQRRLRRELNEKGG